MNESASLSTQKSQINDRIATNPGNSRGRAAGGRWQNLIATNTAIAIGSRVNGGKTEIYVNGMCVQLAGKLTSFPSVVVVNGDPRFVNENTDILLNPTVVVEVLASDKDPGERAQRLENYLAISSIKECFLIRSDEMRVEHYARQNAKQWLYRIYDERDDVVSLDSVCCKLSVAEIYAQVKVKTAELSSKAVN